MPDAAASCHTAIVGDFVIEGHVPAEAIAALVEQRPSVVGLALPGMPADSPGMGGNQRTWAAQPVMAIASNGSLSPFSF